MSQVVDVPNIGTVEFPDDFTESQINSALKSSFGIDRPTRNPVSEAALGVVRGAAQVPIGLVDLAGRGVDYLRRQSTKGMSPSLIERLGIDTSSESYPTQLARDMRTAIEENIPRGTGAGFWTGDVAEGVGQIVPMLATGVGAGALAARGLTGAAAATARAAGAMAGAGALGFGMEFSDAFDREIERQAKEGEPENPDLAFAKGLGYGAVSSLIEAKLGAGRLAKRIGTALTGDTAKALVSRGVSPQLLRQVAGSGLREAGVGFGQEALQRTAQDIIVEGGVDPAAAAYEGLVGGTVQGLLGLPIGGIEASTARAERRRLDALSEVARQEQEEATRRNQLAEAMAAGREVAASRRQLSVTPDPTDVANELRAGRFMANAAAQSGMFQPPPSPESGPVDLFIRQSMRDRAGESIRQLNERRLRSRQPSTSITRRAELESGLTAEQDTGKWEETPRKAGQVQQDIDLFQTVEPSQETSPFDIAVRTGMGVLPPPNPEHQRLFDATKNALDQIDEFGDEPDMTQVLRVRQAAPIVTRLLDNRIEMAIERNARPQDFNPLVELRQRLGRFMADYNAAEQLRSEIPNASAIRESQGQLSQAGSASQGGEAAGGNVVERQPQGEEPVVQGAKAPVQAVTDLGTTPTRQGTPATAPSTPVAVTAGVVAPAPVVKKQRKLKGGEINAEEGQRKEVLTKRNVVSIEDEDAIAAESERQTQARANATTTAAIAPQRIKVGSNLQQTVAVGDEVEFAAEYEVRRRKLKAVERLRGMVRGRVVGQTPSGDVRVEVTEENPPGKSRKKYIGKPWVFGARMVHATGRKISEGRPSKKIDKVSEETVARFTADAPLSRDEINKLISLGYDYDDLWSMDAPEVRNIIALGKRGPGPRPMMIGRRIIGSPQMQQAVVGWQARRELQPAALHVIADLFGRLRALGLRRKTVTARQISSPQETLTAVEQQGREQFKKKVGELRAGKKKTRKLKSQTQKEYEFIETPVSDVSASIQRGEEGQAEYDDLSDLAQILGKPDDIDTAAIFARRFWENIGTIAAPLDQQLDLIQTLLVGGQTPIQQQIQQLEQIEGGEASAEAYRKRFRDALGGTPWIGVTKGLRGSGPAISIGDDVRSIFDKIGVTVVEDPTLDRAAAASISDNGAITIAINPNWLGGLSPEAQAAALQEELAHAGTLRVLAREWEAAGRQGSLAAYVEAQLEALWNEMPQSARDEIVGSYGEGTPVQLAAEAIRRVVQKARTGQITEDFVGPAKNRLVRWFQKLLGFLKQAFVGDGLTPRARELINMTEMVLDGLGVRVAYGDATGASTQPIGATRALRSRQQMMDMAQSGGLEQIPEEMERRYQAVASMFPIENAEKILTRYDELTAPADGRPVEPTHDQLRRERITAGLLRQIIDKLRIVNDRLDLSKLTDPQQRRAAAYAILDTHQWLSDSRMSWSARLGDFQSWREANENFPEKASAKNVEGEILWEAAHNLTKDYKAYLDAVVKLAPPGSTLAGKAHALALKAARAAQASQGEGHVFAAGHVHNLLRWMADQPAITLGPEENARSVTAKAAELVGHIGSDTLGMPQDIVDALLFGESDPNAEAPGNVVIEPALWHVSNLPDIIGALRVLKNEKNELVDRRKEFEAIINNKPGKSVTPIRFLNRYNALRDEYRAAYTIARALNRQWANNENRIAGTSEGLALLDEMMENPTYRKTIRDAVEEVNAFENPFSFSERGNGAYLIVDPISKEPVEIKPGLSKQEEEENRLKIEKLMANISTFTNPDFVGENGMRPDPIDVLSYERAGWQLSAMWQDMTLSPEFNIHNRRIGGLFPRLASFLTNKKYLAEYMGGRPGRMLGLAVNHLDSVIGKITNALINEEYGVAAIQLAYRKAMLEHGLDPDLPTDVEQYRRRISNPLLQSWQHDSQFHYSVGNTLPSGKVVSSSDFDAMKLERKLKQVIRDISETDAVDHNMPSSIADTIGVEKTVGGKKIKGTSKRIHRGSVSDGKYTVPRRSQVNDRRAFVDKFLNTENDSAKLDLIDPSSNPDAFYDVVIGYVFSTHPDFQRISVYETQFRKLVRDGADGRVIKDWNDLAEYLGKTPEEVKKALLPELTAWMQRYNTQEVGAPAVPEGSQQIGVGLGRDTATPMNSILQSLHNDGSFLHPRRKSSAPWTFYTYSDVASANLHSYASNASNIARARVLDAIMTAKQGIDDYIQKYSGANSPDRIDEKRSKELRDKGEIRFTISEAERISKQLQNVWSWFGRYANEHAEAFDKGNIQFIRMLNSMVGGSYLQSPNSIKNNFVSAAFVNPIMTQAMLGNTMGVLLSPFSTAGQIAKVALGRLVAAGKQNPEFARWVNDNRGLLASGLRAMANEWEMTSRIFGRLRQQGINTGLDWKNQRQLRWQQTKGTLLNQDRWAEVPKRGVGAVIPGAAGLETEGTESTALLKLGRWVFNFWMPAMAARYLPRMIDQGANALIAMQWMKAVGKLMADSIDAVDQRVQTLGGDISKLDHTNTSLLLKPEEFGMSPVQMRQLRSTLQPVGSLERIAFDYYRRYKAAKTDEERSNVEFIDGGRMENWMLSLLERGNVVREGNVVDYFKSMGVLGNILGMFWSWPSNFFHVFGTLFEKIPGAKGSAPYVAALIAIMLTAIAAKEIPMPLIELITGKVSGQQRLANVLNEPTPIDTIRYAASTFGSMVPFIGNNIDFLIGGASSRPIFDATSHIPMVGLLSDTFQTAKETLRSGDARLLLDWVNRHAPLYSLLGNRLPGAESDLAARNAARAVRAAVPSDMEVRSVAMRGGGMTKVTPYTRHLRSAEAAAYSGDEAGVRQNIDLAKQYQIDRGQTPEAAEQSVVSYLRSRMPTSRLFGRAITSSEMSRLRSRMSPSQAAAFEPSLKAYGLIERATGKKFSPVREQRPVGRKSGRRLRALRFPRPGRRRRLIAA